MQFVLMSILQSARASVRCHPQQLAPPPNGPFHFNDPGCCCDHDLAGGERTGGGYHLKAAQYR
jgi:hypothetical protein